MKQNNFWKISFFANSIISNERNWMWKTDWTVNIVFIWKIDFETIKTLESSTDRKFLNFSPPKNFNQLLVKQAVVWSLFLTPIAMVKDLHSFSFSKVSLVAKFKSNGSKAFKVYSILYTPAAVMGPLNSHESNQFILTPKSPPILTLLLW